MGAVARMMYLPNATRVPTISISRILRCRRHHINPFIQTTLAKGAKTIQDRRSSVIPERPIVAASRKTEKSIQAHERYERTHKQCPN
jgi:hypothetical protein